MEVRDDRTGRAALETVQEGKYSVDAQGICTFINPAAAQMLGYRQDQCVGRRMHELIHHTKPNGATYPASECAVDRCVFTGETMVVRDDVVWRSDGSRLVVDCIVHPFLTGTGSAGVTVTIRDLTERKAAEGALEERARLAAMTADIGMALTRSDDLPEMLSLCMEVIVSHLDAAFARVWTVDEAGTTLELQASAGLYTHIDGGHARVPVGQFKIGWIAKERTAHLTNDVQHDPHVGDPEWAKRERMVAFAGYPLLVDGELIGVVALFARRALLEDTLNALHAIASGIGLGIVRKRRELAVRESEARFRSILETSLDCIIMMDSESRILEWNPAAEVTFGYRREEVLGRSLPEVIIPPSMRHSHHDGMKLYLASGEGPVVGKRIEITGVRANGSEFPVELAVNRIERQGEPIFTGTIRDISERRREQEELRHAKESAERANTAKSSFLANMSHELRTPLNAILGYSEMLLEEAKESGDETLAKDLTRINSAGQHLLALIGDILDLSKIDAGRMDLYPESFSVETLVRDVASTVEALVARNGNTLEVEAAPGCGSMFADITKMRQNLFNLLSNGAKFTNQGVIRLSARPGDSPDELIFTVSDTGRGIPADRMELLFQPFTQLDKSISREFGGTGLGLTITRRFCQMMGGEITAESEAGRGSTFTIRLPRQYAAPQKDEAVSETEEQQVSSANLVLVIDDDEAARDLMKRNLTRAGLTAALASSGEEGLRLARELKPRVITLDVLMPNMDGWAVLQELKSDPELAEIPVVMATMVADRSLGYSLGAADYLMKPVTRERLQTVLAKYKSDAPTCSVLLVEDDVDTRELMQTMLSRDGWTVTLAKNGLEALERLEKQTPTVILLDLMMPMMDGFELTARLGRHEVWRTIPILVVTAKDLTNDERARLNGQVERILQKDAMRIEELLREIRTSISSCLSQSRLNPAPAH